MQNRPSIRAAGALAALLAIGCAGEGPPGVEEETWLGQIQTEVFDQSCLSGACHNSVTRAGNLSLAAGESYDQLIDIEPENSAARDAGLLRVLPNSVATSYLVSKLTGELTSDEGAQMPLLGSALPPDQIAMIEEWIAAGASETDPPPDSTGPTTPTNPDALVGMVRQWIAAGAPPDPAG